MDHVADTTGLKARESKQLVEGFFDTIRETLASGEECSYPALGGLTFWTNDHDRVAIQRLASPLRSRHDGWSLLQRAIRSSINAIQALQAAGLPISEKYQRKATA